MPPDVLAAHDTGGIDPSEDVPVCVEFGVERLEILGLEGVLLRPVRSAIVGRKYLGETFLELAIGDREAVWSARERQPARSETRSGKAVRHWTPRRV